MTEFWLACRRCATRRPPGPLDYACARCGGELVVGYDGASRGLAKAPGTEPGTARMWRHFERLPLRDAASIVSLGEGDTSLVELSARTRQQLGVEAAFVKCEHLNPTGSFKDRIASVALSIAVERGLPGCVGTSSGNGGAAAAAYAARAGLRAILFTLSDVADQKLLQIRALGAEVYLVDGIGHDAGATEAAASTIAELAARRGFMPLLTGGRYSPEAMEGATTIAPELAMAEPSATAVYVPVGGGGLCAAIWRGYLPEKHRPRIVAVQPVGCPTLRRALAGELSGLEQSCSTVVSGLQVAVLFDGHGAVQAVRDSGGHLIEVDDDAIWAAQAELATEGLLVEPAGATALAGALADARAGRLEPGDRVVLLATGAGYKDTPALRRLAGETTVPRITTREIGDVLSDAARN